MKIELPQQPLKTASNVRMDQTELVSPLHQYLQKMEPKATQSQAQKTTWDQMKGIHKFAFVSHLGLIAGVSFGLFFAALTAPNPVQTKSAVIQELSEKRAQKSDALTEQELREFEALTVENQKRIEAINAEQ